MFGGQGVVFLNQQISPTSKQPFVTKVIIAGCFYPMQIKSKKNILCKKRNKEGKYSL